MPFQGENMKNATARVYMAQKLAEAYENDKLIVDAFMMRMSSLLMSMVIYHLKFKTSAKTSQ